MRAAIIKEVFLLTVAGKGRRMICNDLNNRKVTPFGETNCCGWWPAAISKILRNEALIGHFQPKKQIVNELGKRVSVADGEPREDSKNLGAGRPSLVPVKNMFQGLLYDGYHPESKMALGWGRDYFISDWHRLNPSDDNELIQWNIAELEGAALRYLRGSWILNS